MHTRRFRGYVHGRAILSRHNTRHGALLDRREVGGEPESYARCRRSTVPCCKHLLSAKISWHTFAIIWECPKNTLKSRVFPFTRPTQQDSSTMPCAYIPNRPIQLSDQRSPVIEIFSPDFSSRRQKMRAAALPSAPSWARWWLSVCRHERR